MFNNYGIVNGDINTDINTDIRTHKNYAQIKNNNYVKLHFLDFKGGGRGSSNNLFFQINYMKMSDGNIKKIKLHKEIAD